MGPADAAGPNSALPCFGLHLVDWEWPHERPARSSASTAIDLERVLARRAAIDLDVVRVREDDTGVTTVVDLLALGGIVIRTAIDSGHVHARLEEGGHAD